MCGRGATSLPFVPLHAPRHVRTGPSRTGREAQARGRARIDTVELLLSSCRKCMHYKFSPYTPFLNGPITFARHVLDS
ncbi:unnamed protein product [Arctia plantaginis]|uniref:Uncharacterized protein n=1 Tax=Arctia plantaginis TaxID=874455 RepID=A0A8S1A1Y3_ARCPL|nr:unnamed protein product [Arctia plantaginis]